MELAIFIDNRYPIQQFDRNTYNRVYFGNDLCDIFLPSIEQIKIIKDFSNLPLTLVYPMLSETNFSKAIDCIAYAADVFENNIEIVVNDWGLYHFLTTEQINIKLAVGRILNKNKRDVRIDELDLSMLLTPRGIDALSSPTQQHYAKYYREMGFSRVEVDYSCAYHVTDSVEIPISIWHPFNILAVGRICPFQNNWKSYEVTTTCNLECVNEEKTYHFNNKRSQSEVIHLGNAILYKATGDIPVVCDRVIFNG